MIYTLSLLFGLFQALQCFPLSLIGGQVPASVQTDHGDFLQHIIGQIYFLREGWHWPILMDQQLDAPSGTNIALTDSIPLEALFLKVVHPLFPNMMQGITLYLALCWTLQPVCAVFALRSLGEKRLLPAITIAVLSACFPTFLNRIGHAALCGQWILLLAIGLYFRATRPGAGRGPVWILAALTTLTLLVHPYLMVMAGAILGAVPLTFLLRDRSWRTCGTATIATAVSGLSIIIIGSFLGYWGGSSGGGYGFYSMNLASPFWPVHSSLFPFVSGGPVEATGGQYEGYQYLGAGVLLLLAMLLLRRRGLALVTQLPKQHAGLLLACLALTVIAASNRVYFLHIPVLLTHFRVPGAEQMRSSGRMFWPVAYLIMLGAVYGLCRAWPRAWPLIMLAGIALQWRDTRDIRTGDHQAEIGLLAPATHEDERFFSLMRPFNRIEIHPRLECDGVNSPYVMPFIYAAARQNATVNTMYTARLSPETACQASTERPHPLDKQTLVILTGASQQIHAIHWAALENAHCGVRDKATFCVSSDIPLPAYLSDVPEAATIPVDQQIFTAGSEQKSEEILAGGWSHPEDWGVWSETTDPSLYFHLPADVHTASLGLRMRSTPGKPQHVTVFLDGKQIAGWDVQPNEADYETSFAIPSSTNAVSLQLQISNPIQIGKDPRLLGVALLGLRLHKLD
ncbi:hypothetical protein JK202_07915 [Gluconobacter sp. Dm-62]|uniref:DUF6311 domain-containing protein n=1 Tax=Gluconobacter sp. Dm-62 TaxID=2799804 RepID=UPI001B8D7F0F|nr:hypothetical protein [Gluconobacter sp. Dm-62]